MLFTQRTKMPVVWADVGLPRSDRARKRKSASIVSRSISCRRTRIRRPTLRITPLDVRNHAFPRGWSGYDREEVDTFLRVVSEDYEATLRELQSAHVFVAEDDVVELLGAHVQLGDDRVGLLPDLCRKPELLLRAVERLVEGNGVRAAGGDSPVRIAADGRDFTGVADLQERLQAARSRRFDEWQQHCADAESDPRLIRPFLRRLRPVPCGHHPRAGPNRANTG